MHDENAVRDFLLTFQDCLAPRLDTYEQALYLFIYRSSRFADLDEVTIAFKSARTRLALGIGKRGSPMSESQLRLKLRSLEKKGCIAILDAERTGTRLRLNLPREIPGVVVVPAGDQSPRVLEEIDFFSTPEHRAAILDREDHRCFYCRRQLTAENYVVEHVISRPKGDSSFRNVVAACRNCNNRKGPLSAEDHLRSLFRECFLDEKEFTARIAALRQLQAGELRPVVPSEPAVLTDAKKTPVDA